ncbi:hypothetical protein [Streptomyces sp. NPDC003697]
MYVIVDDFDDEGAVTVLTSPARRAKYTDEHRVPYGTDAVIPEGPAKGFAVGKAIIAS